jgi:hypothetical protein
MSRSTWMSMSIARREPPPLAKKSSSTDSLGLEQRPPQGQQFSFPDAMALCSHQEGHRPLTTQQPVERLAQPTPLNLSRRPLWQLVEDQNAARDLVRI